MNGRDTTETHFYTEGGNEYMEMVELLYVSESNIKRFCCKAFYMKIHSRKQNLGELDMRYFKGKQFKKDIILVAVGYYCRFSLSYRDVYEILKERGISVHPTTIMRWVHEYGNLIY
ncbi:hypothetical protein BVG01_22975 [Bacillus anthracis]|nr:hypothetical protein BVG01_22975 [Bacillus anthracis]